MNEVTLNAEKYIDEIRAVRYNFSITKGNEILTCIPYETCDNCRFDKTICSVERMKWLCSDYEILKPRPILNSEVKNFLKGYKQENYIARGADELLYLFTEKPRKEEDWVVDNGISINISNFLNDYIIQCFDFIQWEDEEPWQIKDLL